MAPYCFIICRILHVLLDDLIDFLHGGAAAFGDALAPFSVETLWSRRSSFRHGVDDRFRPAQFLLVTDASLGRF